MINKLVSRPSLVVALCGVVLAPAAAAQTYVNGVVGFGEKSTTQFGIGIGTDFETSPWGMELNAQTSSSVKINQQSIEQSWAGLSATYRIPDVLIDDMTFKGGLGVASVYQSVSSSGYRNKDYLWYLTPSVELGYQVSRQWDVFASYRFFVGPSFDTLSPNAFFIGARFSWPQSAPSLELIDEYDYEDVEQFEAVASGSTDVNQNISQFIVRDNTDLDVDWQALTLSLSDEYQSDDAALNIPLSEDGGRLEQSLPKGEHILYFTLNGLDRETGEPRQVEGVHSISLYREQSLNFLLTVQSHLLGDSMQVQVF